MREERIVGSNIQVILKNKGLDAGAVASDLGYSMDDLMRICEGRVYLAGDEIEKIAMYFDIEADDIRSLKSAEEYEQAGCIHYNHHFKDQASWDEIMDLFDLVCDIEEVL